MVRAYADLEAAGFVRSTTGRGTFVCAAPPPRPAAAPAPGGAMPWKTLLSRVLGAEPLDRFDRLARQVGGRDLINLSRMQPSEDLIPGELLRRCADHVLRSQGPRALGYAPPEGLPRLRGLIAEHLGRQGVPARAEDLIVTTGSQQGIDLVARALIDPGDAFLVDTATYTGAIKLLTLAGAHLIPVPSDDEGPDLGALERLGRAGTKGFYLIPSSHNPTGMVVSAPRRQAHAGGRGAPHRQAGLPRALRLRLPGPGRGPAPRRRGRRHAALQGRGRHRRHRRGGAPPAGAVEVGAGVEVLGRLRGEPVLLREGSLTAATYHPELTDDRGVHRERFLAAPAYN